MIPDFPTKEMILAAAMAMCELLIDNEHITEEPDENMKMNLLKLATVALIAAEPCRPKPES